MKSKFNAGLVACGLLFLAVMIAGIAGTAPARVARAQGPEESGAVVAWDSDGNKANNKSFLGTTNNKPLVLKTNKVEQMRILANGSIGIGTANPASKLHVVSRSGDVPPRVESLGSTSFTSGWDFYHGDTGKGYVGVPDSGASFGANELMLFGGTGTKTSLWAGAARSVTIDTNGNVGIGETDPTQTLDIKGTFKVSDPQTGLYKIHVGTDRTFSVGALASSTTHHLCYFGTYTLSTCSSAAEYVPSVDTGKGFPQTADLVSIAPDIKNPYGDAHGPFAVEKSAKPCDSNLLGYIVKPESGADGVYLNEHYLPLAIYGYFPAKVSMENGVIKRGDPITSGSTPGYGMKATGACKIIGYALEDANVSGTIQVFANFGDSSAAQVSKLEQENEALKQLLANFGGRIARLEETEARLSALSGTGAPKNALAALPNPVP